MGAAEGQSQPGVEPFAAPLQALHGLIEALGGRGVIVGGVAASLLGAPRFTADLDAVVLLEVEEIPCLMRAAAQHGLQARIPDAEEFARQYRMVLLRHAASGVDVDVALGMLPFEEEMIARSQEVAVGGLRLRLPTPEDLVVMKAVAHRPKDLMDIRAVVARYPHLDRRRVEGWVRQFADALDQPQLWEEIAPLINVD